MKADAILNKIQEDARTLSADILQEAREKSERMQADAQSHMQELRRQTEKRAEEEISQMRKQMESLNELEIKKQILSEKRSLIDETFEQAIIKLRKADPELIRQRIIDLIVDLAEGGEQLSVGEYASGWYNSEVLDNINKALIQQGKQPLSFTSNIEKNCTGAVLSKSGVDTVCTLEAVLMNLRSSIENEVASELFDIGKEI